MCCRRRPAASLRGRKAFRQVYQEGRHVAGPLFVIYSRRRSEPTGARLGLSVSRKVGNAVVRNRVKRLVKESLRLRTLPNGRDYIVVARAAAGQLPRTSAFEQVDTALAQLIKRLEATDRARRAPAAKSPAATSEEAKKGFARLSGGGLGAAPPLR